MSAVPLYLVGKGEIRRRDNTIVILGEGRPIYKPVVGILSLYIYGRYRINTSLIGFLDSAYIPIHIFSRRGDYRGTFYNPPMPSSEVFVRQVEYFADHRNYASFAYAMKESYEKMRRYSCEPLDERLMRYFKGLLYATITDAIYMTHLDPTAIPSTTRVSMPLVYMFFGVYQPVLTCVANGFLQNHPLPPSAWYRCRDRKCLRAEPLKKLVMYWEKLMSSTVKYSWGKGPRRMLFRMQFWALERTIMWGERFQPYVGPWHTVSVVGGG